MFKEENDDLLAELNGEAATPQEAKELAAAELNAKTDPLVVAPKPKPSAAQRAAAEAAKKGPVAAYAVTVEGLYLAPAKDSPGKKVKKSYTLTVNLPSLEGALYVIKNKLLDKRLKMKYPDYTTFLTHEIVDVKTVGANAAPSDNIAYMGEPELLAHIKYVKAPINPKNYDGDIKGLRAAVVDFTVNPKGFAEREAVRVKDRAEDLELERLNAEEPV